MSGLVFRRISPINNFSTQSLQNSCWALQFVWGNWQNRFRTIIVSEYIRKKALSCNSPELWDFSRKFDAFQILKTFWIRCVNLYGEINYAKKILLTRWRKLHTFKNNQFLSICHVKITQMSNSPRIPEMDFFMFGCDSNFFGAFLMTKVAILCHWITHTSLHTILAVVYIKWYIHIWCFVSIEGILWLIWLIGLVEIIEKNYSDKKVHGFFITVTLNIWPLKND